ncbi:unnamed protein product [marine sediment metagenome]|uniref:Pyrroline-5-carboxylate reductase n=1 Tax=marine sediment metagenome TaxID=412755 RepID=X0UDC7_9ZZZZ
MVKVGFIGAGNMALALIKAIKKANLADSIYASDVKQFRLKLVEDETGINVTPYNKVVVNESDVIFLAVKPQQIDKVLDEIRDTNKLIISIAAGITLKHLADKLKNARVVRVMPNTPCLVGEMAAGFALGPKVKDEDVKIVEELLNSAGKAFLLKESMLDAVTGLSGSGPAFIAYLIQCLIEASVEQGLSKDIATELAERTALGTAKLLIEKGLSPKELIKMVASPGGTTIAGLEVLIKSDVRNILIETVEKATKRSKELGKK